ncbi:MAG: PepSY-like domain-containing protein [Muribaculaceae bacterium]|nr:PepSY-like domain-containing protein [Muribaculaceae bacterium]
MKKIFLTAIFAIIMCLSASADKYSIKRSDLPQTAQEFLSTYFPKNKVSMVKTDRHLLKKTDYDVKLTNGTKIEFNNKGEWTSVDCKTREVPQELILKAIRRYLNKNFSDVKVVKIERKSLSYELTLSDGVELKFDRLGIFQSMKMDD